MNWPGFIPALHFTDNLPHCNMIFPLQLLVFVPAVSAAVLQTLQSINNQILTTNGSEILLLSNVTASAPSDLSVVRAQCIAQRFGSNLNVTSCQNAFGNIYPDDTYSSFGMRHDGSRYDNYLPYQWLSGMQYSSSCLISQHNHIIPLFF